jgi:hypothetical protein
MVQSGGKTPADQINARFAVRVKTAVYEPVTTTLACLVTHIWLPLRTVQYTEMFLYDQLEYNIMQPSKL